MPSPHHDAIVDLFRERPALAVELLAGAADVGLSPGDHAQLANTTFNDRPSKDFHPDAVITVGPARHPRHAIVVEVQQDRSESKRRQLPRYAASLWLMLQCPVSVLVICPDDRTATHFAEPIPTTLPGYTFRAISLGPQQIPALTDPAAIAANPELGLLTLLTHPDNPDVIEAWHAGVLSLNEDDAARYYEHGFDLVRPATREILEKLMSSTDWLVVSPFAREHYGRGEREGRLIGEREGHLKGAREGEHRQAVEAALDIIDARGLTLTDTERERITTCTDLDQLRTWRRRAITARSTADIFD